MTSLEKTAYGFLALLFAVGTVAAYQITSQGLFGVVGAVFTGACLYKALGFDWS